MVLNRVLVTGASGMVGRQVTARLAADGIGCTTTSRTRPENLADGIAWVGCDLARSHGIRDLEDIFGTVDAVVHCAALIPAPGTPCDDRAMFDVNAGASLQLGHWARQIGARFIHISSSSVYAEPDRMGIKESDDIGGNALSGLYGVSKLAAELALSELVRGGLDATVLRPSSIYGPGLAAGKMIPVFLDKALQGETISLTPPVDDRVDLIFSGDVAGAVTAALKTPASGTFNVGSEKMSRIADIAEACVRVAGKGKVAYPDGTTAAAPVSRFGLDCTAARESLGFTAQTPLEQGLAVMLEDLIASARKA